MTLVTRARELLAAATPGPWSHGGEARGTAVLADNGRVTLCRAPAFSLRAEADAAFIAAAPQLVADLVAEVERLENDDELDFLKDEIAQSLPAYATDDGENDPCSPLECIELAGRDLTEMGAANEKLRAENARLRAALEPFADPNYYGIAIGDGERARSALAEVSR